MPRKEKPEAILEFEVPGQPYSTCVKVGKHHHFAGTIGDMENGQLKSKGDFEAQVAEVLRKMIDLLSAVGLAPDDVHDATIWFVSDNPERDYDYINKQWEIAFGPNPCGIKPARGACAVVWLPKGALFEVKFDAVRQCKDKSGCACNDVQAHPGD